MDVVPPLISDPEATVLMQPTQGPLHHPAEDAQSTAVLRPPLGQHRLDPELTKPLPVRLRIVTSVALHPIGTTPGMARLALHRRDALNNGANPLMSGTLAPVVAAVSGMPCASVRTWCLLPGLPRSTGLGPVPSPP